ncbi:MAG: hypothetical protein ACRDO2_11280, partial [Nocardioidaceae bacterium]
MAALRESYQRLLYGFLEAQNPKWRRANRQSMPHIYQPDLMCRQPVLAALCIAGKSRPPNAGASHAK